MSNTTTVTYGPSPIQGERWMSRHIRRDDDGRLAYRDVGPGWFDREWTPALTGATVESIIPPGHVTI